MPARSGGTSTVLKMKNDFQIRTGDTRTFFRINFLFFGIYFMFRWYVDLYSGVAAGVTRTSKMFVKRFLHLNIISYELRSRFIF